MSRVMCHVSPVTCQKTNLQEKKIYIYSLQKIGQSGGANRWRVDLLVDHTGYMRYFGMTGLS